MKKLIYIMLLVPVSLVAQPVGQGVYHKGISLDSCKALAFENNYRVKAAANEVEQSEQLRKNAFTNYFPKVNAGFSALKMSDYMFKSEIPQMNLPVYNGNPATLPLATQFAYFPAIPMNMFDYMNFGIAMATQPLFTGGRIFYGNKLARTGVEIYREKEAMTITEALVKTEELYWSIISLSEKLSTVNSYRKLLASLDRDVSSALDAGLVKKTDLLKVQLKRNELDLGRLKLLNGISLSKKALFQHIGMQNDTSIALTDTLYVEGDPSALFINPEDAVRNRTEYRILEKAAEAEKLQQKVITGEYLPQVAVGVAGVYTDFMDKTNQLGVAFATVSIPISDWWGGSHKIKQGMAKVENAENNLNETAELLTLQITKLQDELKQSYFAILNGEKSVEQARENLKITTDNYDAGVSGMSDLLEAQSLYQDAQNSLTEAKCNYRIALARYRQSVNDYK